MTYPETDLFKASERFANRAKTPFDPNFPGEALSCIQSGAGAVFVRTATGQRRSGWFGLNQRISKMGQS